MNNPMENKVFVIDKTSGPTSFQVVAAFRRATGVRKVGHSGTLDPLAQGVLLLCTGLATRAVEHFMNLEKVYEFDVHLGVETTTLDAEGEVVNAVDCPDIPEADILAAAGEFVGDYELVPPAYSAIKVDGRRLYELARSGERATAPSRVVQIYSFEVTNIELPKVRCRVRCSRGTYVRSLARDLGARLGLPAHITRLVRTRIGPFRRDEGFSSLRLDARDTDGLRGHSLESALDFMPGIVLGNAACRGLFQGALPGTQDVIRAIGVFREGPVRVMDEAGNLLAVGRRRGNSDHNRLHPIDSFRLFVDAAAIDQPTNP